MIQVSWELLQTQAHIANTLSTSRSRIGSTHVVKSLNMVSLGSDIWSQCMCSKSVIKIGGDADLIISAHRLCVTTSLWYSTHTGYLCRLVEEGPYWVVMPINKEISNIFVYLTSDLEATPMPGNSNVQQYYDVLGNSNLDYIKLF